MKLTDSKPATRRTVAAGVAIGSVAVSLALFGVFGGSKGDDPVETNGKRASVESTTTTEADMEEPAVTTTTPPTVPAPEALDDRVGQLEDEVDELDGRIDSIESTTTTAAVVPAEPAPTTTSWWNPSGLTEEEYRAACDNQAYPPDWCYKTGPPS